MTQVKRARLVTFNFTQETATRAQLDRIAHRIREDVAAASARPAKVRRT